MAFINLEQYQFNKVNMEINILDGQMPESGIAITSKFSLNLNYSETNDSCLAVLEHSLKSNPDGKLVDITVSVVGLFECKDIVSEDSKREAHIHAYNQLFPYAQYLVAQLTGNPLTPPLMIQKALIKAEDISIDGQSAALSS